MPAQRTSVLVQMNYTLRLLHPRVPASTRGGDWSAGHRVRASRRVARGHGSPLGQQKDAVPPRGQPSACDDAATRFDCQVVGLRAVGV